MTIEEQQSANAINMKLLTVFKDWEKRAVLWMLQKKTISRALISVQYQKDTPFPKSA